MNFIDNILIIGLIAAAFFLGKHISDKYHEKIMSEYEYLVRLDAAKHGMGYVAPPQKVKRAPIGQDFMDRLKSNGRATQQINP